MAEIEDLSQKRCKPCEGGTRPLNRVMVEGFLTDLPGWEYKDPSAASPSAQGSQLRQDSAGQAGGQAGQVPCIEKTFTFKNYYETMAFVNAVAFISHREDHHPDLEVGYKTCKVRYTTHAIKGLSENDFICAAKVEKLLKDS